MKKTITILSILLFSLIAAAQAPQKIRKNVIQIGIGGSTADKEFVVDVGDGATNPRFVITQADKLFSFNKEVRTVTNSMQLGDGTAGADQCVTFDTGDAGSNKKLCILQTSKDASLNVDAMSIGDGTAANQEFILDIGAGASNPRIRWNNTDQVLQFSNDGSTFKNIGSGGGGGGGINILAESNFDFESGDPPQNFSATGGTFTAETVAPAFGLQSGSWNASATSQFLRSEAIAIPEGLKGRACSARIQYKFTGGTVGHLGWRVEDSSDVLIAGGEDFSLTAKNIDPTTDWKEDIIFFTCPSSGDMRIEIESSADAALLLTDNWELGKVGFVNVSQNELVTYAYYADTGLCTGWSTTSGTFVDIGTDTDCPSITVESTTQPVDTTDNDLPDLVYPNMEAGKYLITMYAFVQGVTGVTNQYAVRLSDGSNVGQECGIAPQSSGDAASVSCTMLVEYGTSGPRTFRVQGLAQAGTLAILNNFSGRQLTFVVERFPSGASEAINLETSGFLARVAFVGVNPSLGLANQTVYNDLNDASLTMSVSGNEFAPAGTKISCTAPNVSTGLTCSAGNEQVGVVMPIAIQGTYEVCANFTHAIGTDSANDVIDASFQMVRTVDGSDTVLEFGGGQSSNRYHEAAASAGIPNDGSVVTCGIFRNVPAGEHAFKLFYTQATGGSPTSSLLRADDIAASGNRRITFTVKNITQNFPMPVFTSLQTALQSKLEVKDETNSGPFFFQAAQILAQASPVFSSNPMGHNGTLDNGGVGQARWNFATPYTQGPVCVTEQAGSTGNRMCTIDSTTNSSVSVRVRNPSTGATDNQNCAVVCIGR